MAARARPGRRSPPRCLPSFAGRAGLVAACVVLGAGASAQDAAGAAASPATRPALNANRWQEDWSALADGALRTEPLDGLKYIALSDADRQRYLSLGATLRERFESNAAPALGSGHAGTDAWVIERLQLHADLHAGEHLRAFVQIEDDRAFAKRSASSADQDRADLRLAFLETTTRGALGTLKARIGRQDFAFDLQRFVSSRDGPNVRQSFDAAWADWESADWRLIGFVSRPVQYKDGHAFDDASGAAVRFDTLRLERHVLGDNELSAYWSLFQRANARYGDAAGAERRQVFDARFAGSQAALDWDLEAMLQAGSVGASRIRAWAIGPRVGYTFTRVDWQPRIGLQVDAASGDTHRGDTTLGTFNPLFPNGYYFALAGYTGYANVLHLKPTLTLKPARALSVTTALGLLWRQSVADAVYTQPNVAVAGTAGQGKRWTGAYAQLRADYAVDAHLWTALEAVRYRVGDTLRAAGARDSSYVGVELKALW